jgi:DNA-binding IclR family transcriptional regulator
MGQSKPKKTFLPVRFRKLKEFRGQLRPAPPLVVDRERGPAQPNQSLIDSMQVLQALVFSDRPLPAADIGRQLGLDPTRAHRLLRTLSLLGLAFQTKRKRFVTGPAMHVLAAQSLLNSDLASAARGPLDLLHRETELEVVLGMLWQDYVSYLYHAAPDMPLEAAPGNVSMFPASLSSLGRVLMSSLPDEQVREIYRGRPIPGYDDANDDPAGIERLIKALDAARADGFARVERVGVSTGRVSIAIHLPSRPFAAIGIGGEISRAQTPKLLEKLRHAAAAIDATLEPNTPSGRA